MGKAARSSKTRQTELIGVRLNSDLKSLLDERAKENGISPTSQARVLLARSLGFSNKVETRPPSRRCTQKTISQDLKRAVCFLDLLQDMRGELRYLKQMLARTQDDPSEYYAIAAALAKISASLHGIQIHVTGGNT